MSSVSKEDFQTKLELIFKATESLALPSIYLRSGDLHRSVGGYPGPNHRMPVCCDVMYKAMREEDEIIQSPPKGKGANLIIRFMLPR